MQTIAEQYAEFCQASGFDKLPSPVIHQAKRLVLDLIGVALGGYQMMEFPRLVVDYVVNLGGRPEATVVHAKTKIPAIHATLANAACAHALDMDDGHRFGALHPGAVVIPAALAASELARATTKQFIAGIVAGYEIMIRIGMATNPSSLNRGFHTTGQAGTFGAAAACSCILGLTERDTVAALALAGMQSAGLLQVNHDPLGAKAKPLNPARAASAGILAALLAGKGAQGPRAILEGEDGYLHACADEFDKDVLTRDLGSTYEILNVYNKFYAACRHTHAPIDAAISLHQRGWNNEDEIDSINVKTYPAAMRLAGIVRPSTASAARFSISFSVALALLKGEAGADKYTDQNVRDESIQRLADRVVLEQDDKWTSLYPRKRGATVTIIDRKGRTETVEVDLPRGEPENRATWNELYDKFISNATLLVTDESAFKIGEVIGELEERSITDLTFLI
jgi:2-methylcitrate dehydratase PrpD|uniref:MmgE/PrpD family protein n=1 Tax=Desulfomonile tiedjei TaxID=2358 RepID=A0A7C4EVV1_9BACT